MIYCNKCKNKVVMHAFSEGFCEVCKDSIFCNHTPCDLVCFTCAEDFNLCESCGSEIDKELCCGNWDEYGNCKCNKNG